MSKEPGNPARLENDKKATEYLANERTFLAWIRTSVSVISFGFVIAKFSVWMREMNGHVTGGGSLAPPTGHSALTIGEIMMGIGALFPLAAAWRYHRVNQAIRNSDVRTDHWLVWSITAIIFALALVMIAYLIQGPK